MEIKYERKPRPGKRRVAQAPERAYNAAMNADGEKMVLFHGLGQDEAVKAMRAVKAALETGNGVAFAMTTETNLGWTVADLVEHVLEEHAQMTGGRPGADPR